MQKVAGWVENGNIIVSIASTGYTSSTKVQGSFPLGTVTVYNTGTLTLASIYSDDANTPTAKANPFTASQAAQWSFYAANGVYDIKFSGGGILIPFTIGAISIGLGDAGVPSYAYASLPVNKSQNAGNLARVTDRQGGLWMDTGFQWIKEFPPINVKDAPFNAVGDGTADDTAAIQAAINAGGSNCNIYFPPGTYKVTSTLNVTGNRVHLTGYGKWATTILFMPTADDTCLYISAGVNIIAQGSVCGFTFYSNDSTHTKVAIDSVDVSDYLFEDLIVHGSVAGGNTTYWSGGTGSIAFRTSGREITNINRCDFFADKPIRIMTNPNANLTDHYHYSNLYLIGNNQHLIEVQDGCVIQHLKFDGYQSWVKGLDGFRWVDTTNVQANPMVSIENVGREQVESNTAYVVRISFTGGDIQNLTLNNFYGPAAGQGGGLYLRHIDGASITNMWYVGDGVALNADSTCVDFFINNFPYDIVGGTLSVTGFVSFVYLRNSRMMIGTFDATEQINLGNVTYVGFRTAGGASTIKGLGLDAADVLRINYGATGYVRVDGVLTIGTEAPTSHRVVIANGQAYAGINAAGSNSVAIASIGAADQVAIAPSGTVTDFGGYIGKISGFATQIRNGSNSPEGVVTAGPGSIYLNINGGANTTLYVKESGTGNTGWAAK